MGLEWIKRKRKNNPSFTFSYKNYIDFLGTDKTVWERVSLSHMKSMSFECWRLKVEIVFTSSMFHYILAIEGVGIFY